MNGTSVNYSKVRDGYSNQGLTPVNPSDEGYLIEYKDYTDGDSDPSTFTWKTLVDLGDSVHDDIESANTQMRSNADLYVGNLYSTYSPGDINNSSVIDPTTLAQEFSTDYNSTGYYAYAGAEAALTTGANATFNESMVLVGSESGNVYNGSIYTSWSPASTNGEFVVDHEYHISNASSPVYFATNDGLVLIQENFTLTEMVNVKTGESVNSTQLQDYTQQTSDPSLTVEEFERLLELRNEVEEAEAAAGAGGGSGLNTEIFGMPAYVLLLIAAAGAMFLSGRD
jgi:hypothetical protein